MIFSPRRKMEIPSRMSSPKALQPFPLQDFSAPSVLSRSHSLGFGRYYTPVATHFAGRGRDFRLSASAPFCPRFHKDSGLSKSQISNLRTNLEIRFFGAKAGLCWVQRRWPFNPALNGRNAGRAKGRLASPSPSKQIAFRGLPWRWPPRTART